MLNLVMCEFWKLKRKRLFHLAFAASLILPLFYSLILSNNSLDNMMTVVREESGLLLLIPLTVVLAANLFFLEHDCDTLKNLACVPISKGSLAVAKLLVLLLFNLCYQLVGFAAAVLLTIKAGMPLDGLGLQLALNIGTGILVWAAAMPCVLLVVWCNKSYIISVMIAFAYTILCFILRITEKVMMVPLGVNLSTLLPTPIIARWLFQFHPLEEMGTETLAFFQRLTPYFVSTPVAFAILLGEALVCTLLMVKLYQRQHI